MEGLKNGLPFWTSRIALAQNVGGGLFDQKSRRAQRDHFLDVGVITVRGENEHLGVRDGFGEFAGWLPSH